MSLPGVTTQFVNGQLGIVPSSAENSLIYAGCCTNGVPGTLTFFGSQTALLAACGLGEAAESAALALKQNGGSVGVLVAPATNAGGFSAVTHVGTGANGMTVAAAPHQTVLITITTAGALGTSKFTYQVGTGPVSQPVVTPVGHTFLVPGTYCTVTFPTHTYAALETYSVSILGVVTYAANGSGGSDATMTQASSPIDDYTPTITVSTGGALGTAQFTYSTDGTVANTSPPILTSGGGTYAIPNTGIFITFAGALVVGDSYSFTTSPPSSTNSDLTAALASLETTYLSSLYSMLCPVGNLASAAAFSTQATNLEGGMVALDNLGLYARAFSGAPTIGTRTASAGSVVVDNADNDATLIAAKIALSAPHVFPCAGDELIISAITGLQQRRNASWSISARAAGIEASRNPGDGGLGGLPSVVGIYRDETATPALDAVGFNTLRTFPGNIASGTGLPGFFITDFHTGDSVTSDYYRGMNARVIDIAATILRATGLPLVNSKIATTTRNGHPGVITERKAQAIEALCDDAMDAALVFTNPQDAVAVKAIVNRTNNILATGQLLIDGEVQPFGYARTITFRIGFTVQA